MFETHEDTQPLPVAEAEAAEPQALPAQQPRSQGGCGCWLPALLTAFVAAVLVLVGSFLPPVNLWDRFFGTQYAVLSASANAVQSDDGGLILKVDPATPGRDFGVALDSVPVSEVLAGGAQSSWAAASQPMIPLDLALQSPIYRVQTSGSAPETVTLDFTLPDGAAVDLLSLYGWNAESGEWRFIPAAVNSAGLLTATLETLPEQVALFQGAPPAQPTVLVAVDIIQNLSPDSAQIATIVSPAGLQPTLQGTLQGNLAAGYDRSAPYLGMPVIRNFQDARALDIETVTTVLANSTLRGEHIRQIVAFASADSHEGVFIDYRDLPADQRENFSAFITELGTSLNSGGLLLGVVLPEAQNVAGRWETGAYDWRALGAAADFLQINMGLNPAIFKPGAEQFVEAMLRWAVTEVDRRKLLIGLSARSVREAGGDFSAIGYTEALAGLGDVALETALTESGTIVPGSEIKARLNGLRAVAGVETEIEAAFVEYQDGGDAAVKMWLTNGDALRYRMNWSVPFALGGVAFQDLLASGIAADVMPAILNYKMQLPAAPTSQELALRWRIESASGTVGETTTRLNDELIITLEAPDGNYAVNVAVVGAGLEAPRSGAAVALFAPTPTPTPVPTATPTPEPTATPVPVVQAPVQAAAPPAGGGAPAVAPGAGSIAVGNFEYGGHVTGTASDRAADAMRSAGMNWMKIQLRYSPGMDAGVAAGPIGDAKARGFKILLGVVGSPGDLAAGGGGYVSQFASFLGALAGQGPDAIEIWNEPNIDREWPRDQISGAAYADMLRQGYQAIKGANGGVMVISGAPAPTGAEAAFPGQVVNDDNWVRDMINAGGLQWMDCLGAHYNEGIVGPSLRSGDRRDGYYTRYFFGMLDTYWGLSGGQKPICFTELGYLTPEGYPPLPGFFGWAQNVTIGQQAAWLAEAAALASQSGRVRLMIVWNVDFTNYGSDPMAGYAMIRADGSCPACNAMAAAR